MIKLDQTPLWLTILIALIAALGGSVITHIFYKSKLAKDTKFKLIYDLSEKRIEAIKSVKRIVNELDTYEALNVVHPITDSDFELYSTNINSGPIYPSVMENIRCFDDFCDRLLDCRDEYSEWLDIKSNVYFTLANWYIMELRVLIGKLLASRHEIAIRCKEDARVTLSEEEFIELSEAIENNQETSSVDDSKTEEDGLYVYGTRFYPEIKLWSRKMDFYLTKSINNPPLKNPYRRGLLYNFYLNLARKKFHKCLVYKMNHAKDIDEMYRLFYSFE